ncbi:MAG: hypothetical protein J1E39_05275 [Eubacterium sp.]|nr:hypothetical protein [Eubacterium sp.]
MNTKAAIKFTLGRMFCLRPRIIGLLLPVLAMSLLTVIFPSQPEDFDYFSWIWANGFGMLFSYAFAIASISDIYNSRYIRTSTLYNAVIKTAVPVAALACAAVLQAIISLIHIVIGSFNHIPPAATADIVFFSAAQNALFMLWLTLPLLHVKWAFFVLYSMAYGFTAGFMEGSEVGFTGLFGNADMPLLRSLIISAGLLAAMFFVTLFIGRLYYRRRGNRLPEIPTKLA